MINPVWLKTFCTLAEIGHFTKTANKLFMTQSGVSQHIKKLEQQLGITLLIRDGKSFTLNDAGNKLFIKGQELLKYSQELERLITQDEAHEGSIIMASPGSVGLQLYPHLLNIQTKYPKLVINYDFAPNRSIEQRIANREMDLGIISQRSSLASVVCEKIAIEPLVLVTSREIQSIDWQMLLSLGFISHPDASHHGQLLLSKNFAEFEHVNQFIQRGSSNQISLILEPICKGLGFTVLPLFAAKAFHRQHLINIHLLDNSVSESLYLCFNKHAIPTNRIKFIKSAITEFLG